MDRILSGYTLRSLLRPARECFMPLAERFKCSEPKVGSPIYPQASVWVSWRYLKGITCTLCKGKERTGVGHNPWPRETSEIERSWGIVRKCLPWLSCLFFFFPFLDVCPPTLFFHSFVHTFLKYLPNTYFRHKPGLARAGVYRRRLFSPLPLNGSSLLLFPHNSVVTGVDGYPKFVPVGDICARNFHKPLRRVADWWDSSWD